MEGFKFSTIEEAVADLRAGKMIIGLKVGLQEPARSTRGQRW